MTKGMLGGGGSILRHRSGGWVVISAGDAEMAVVGAMCSVLNWCPLKSPLLSNPDYSETAKLWTKPDLSGSSIPKCTTSSAIASRGLREGEVKLDPDSRLKDPLIPGNVCRSEQR
ncbi:hypothetical protein BaRGS_00006910 [Batillaria attramentaria]|uniref:Uncharacterized protein n=1 Tax=Batillaria attramentaria TaxID=370345 RepID=A0ABD0LQM5_9CAEN